MVIINNYEEYKALEGQVIGVSGWHRIDQARSTRSRMQPWTTSGYMWIRNVPQGKPFKTTIAHGYLTLSLIPYLWKQIADVRNVRMEINYGIESLRFGQPVQVDSEVQLQARIKAISDLRGTVKAIIQARLAIRGQSNPAYGGDLVFLYHFN